MIPSSPPPAPIAVPRLAVALSAGQEPAAWRARNAAGQVASPWPYALNLLDRQFTLLPIVSDKLGPGRLARLWFRSLTGFRNTPGNRETAEVEYSLSWDEHMALRSLALVNARRYVSGLIWLSDDVATGTERLRRLLFRSVLRELDGIFFSSRAQLEITRSWLRKSSIALEWIPMGVDPDFFPRYAYPASPFVFSMGSDKHRDPETLGRALALVLDRNPEAEILVQTNRPEAFPRGIETVERLGGEDIRRNFERASVVVIATLPNVHVSGITVALEGMSSGRPIVMTANPGLDDYVREGESGFLTRPGDPEEFAARIVQILADPALGERMGLSARRSVDSTFNVTVMNDAIARFISGIPLDDPPRR